MIWKHITKNKFYIYTPQNKRNVSAPNESYEYVGSILKLIEAVFI